MFSYITASAASLVSGIYLADSMPYIKASELIAISIVLWGILFFSLKTIRRKITVCTLFLVLGIISLNYAGDYTKNPLYPFEGKYTTLTGHICDLPEMYDGLYSYRLRLESAEYLGNKINTDEVIRLTSDEKLNFGDELIVKGFLKTFFDKKNSTDYNTKRFYQSHGVFYKAYAREITPTKLKSNKWTISYAVNYVRNGICKAIDSEFDGDRAAVLKAISCGNKKGFSEDYHDLMIKTGMTKYLYSPFFHIHLIFMLVGFFFSRMRKSTRDYLLIVAFLLYAIVNSHAPVFFKNSLFLILGIVMVKRYGFSHLPDTLGITVLSIVLVNPLFCFDVGFSVSVICTLMFYYFYDILYEKLWFIPFGRKFVAFYILTTFGMLPFMAYFFSGIAPYTNLFAPFFSLVVGVLIFLVPLSAIFIKLFGSSLFLKPIISVLSVPFLELPVITDKLPLSHIYLPLPGIAVLLAFFLTLYVFYQSHLGLTKSRKAILATVVASALWLSIPAGYISNLGRCDITFVNVDQGDGAVIDIAGGETILVDGGGKTDFSTYDWGKNIFLPYLIDNGHTKIDIAFVSHCHGDHVLGIIAAAKTLSIGEIIMPAQNNENEHHQELVRIASERNIPIRYLAAGDTLRLKSGLNIDILSPDADSLSDDENENSLVLEFSYKGFTCLFTGDIGTETEHSLLNSVSDVDIVKMAHHGSANSNSYEFANAITAEYAICSAGENNIYGFPKDEAVKNYQDTGAKVLRTDKNGEITVRIEKDGNYRIFRNNP